MLYLQKCGMWGSRGDGPGQFSSPSNTKDIYSYHSESEPEIS